MATARSNILLFEGTMSFGARHYKHRSIAAVTALTSASQTKALMMRIASLLWWFEDILQAMQRCVYQCIADFFMRRIVLSSSKIHPVGSA
jgi:hypothetical protein